MRYKHDDNIRRLLPPLSPEARAELKAGILKRGRVTDPLTVWQENGILLDGYHRDEIVTELRAEGHSIPDPPVAPESFPDLHVAQAWIFRHQNGRRNLTADDLARTILGNTELVEWAKAEARKRMLAGKKADPSLRENKGDWRSILAELAGVGRCKIDEWFLILGDRQARRAVDSGYSPRMVAGNVRTRRARIRETRRRRVLARNTPRVVEGEPWDRRIINADVLDAMREIPDDSVDLVFTSPPYPIIALPYPPPARNYDGNYRALLAWLLLVWKECYRVLKPGGRLIINLDNPSVPEGVPETPRGRRRGGEREHRHYELDGATAMRRNFYADTYQQCTQVGFTYADDILWWKQAYVSKRPMTGSASAGPAKMPSPASPRIQRNWELLPVFYKGARAKLAGDLSDVDITRAEFDFWTGGDWIIMPDVAKRKAGEHVAAFSLELPWRVIKVYTYRTSLVLDPFAGSGTTLVAAAALGRRWIGIEVVPMYAKQAREAVAEALKNPPKIKSPKKKAPRSPRKFL